MKTKAKVGIGAVAALVVLGWLTHGSDQPTASTTTTGSDLSSASTAVDAASEQSDCMVSDAPYNGDGKCRPGAELVTVSRVVDGDTLELGDGRKVGLLGLDAPAANTCAGPGARKYTAGAVEGKQVSLYREPGHDLDKYGRTLAYVAIRGHVLETDLGRELTNNGWAKPFKGDANADYQKEINDAYDFARHLSVGMRDDQCGKPDPYPATSGSAGSSGSHGHVNLPDGALTGGFCAKKWWC